MKIIIFDFDGTLTKRDTIRPFASFIAKKYNHNYQLFLFYACLVLHKLKLISDKKLKESFLQLFVKTKSSEEMEEIVNQFFEDRVQNMINNPVLDKLKNHVHSHDRVYIASANFDFLLKALVKKWNISGVISTETEQKNGYFTGKILGNTCKGENKLKKIESVLGVGVLKHAIAYADDEDKLLLDSVGQGIRVT
ncbi:MAG: Phosphoserine phosphatase [Candidatus Jettenia ecosi]|uniref:Phosphoserine phosphatase n=1 Tax=Candidatus Jettenia ecosi TaxID=2494326 RepID=A0A533Q7F1_9BACT|nr:MAG: Phosphoserine phosphatase [Candidatus Jettenia ecosi]